MIVNFKMLKVKVNKNMTLSRIDLCHRGEQRERLCRTTDLFLCTVWSNTTEWRHKCNHILGFIHFSVGICSLCVRWTFGVKPTENPLCTRPSKAGQAQWLFCFLNGDIVAWVQQATSVTGHEQHEIHQHTHIPSFEPRLKAAAFLCCLEKETSSYISSNDTFRVSAEVTFVGGILMWVSNSP